MRRKKVMIFAVAAMLALSAGCAKRDVAQTTSGQSTGTETSGAQSTEAAQEAAAAQAEEAMARAQKEVDPSTVKGKENNKDLVVAFGSDTTTLDPHCAGNSAAVNVLLPVVEQLVRYDADGNLQPWLAESYEILDPQTIQFHLRKGVKFHNGEEMKASDVVFSFKRATTDYAANVAYIMDMVDPDGLEIIDDYTVNVRTKVPFASFIYYMPYIGASIISEKAYQSDEAIEHPVGTGPYRFVEYKKGDYVKYEKNPDYWKGEPACDTLTIKAIPDVTQRYIALETGEVDIAVGLTVNEVSQIADNPDLTLATPPTTVFTTLNFNCAKAPFDNEKFRQAIDYAINEEAVVQAVFRGSAQYTPGPVTPNTKYFYDGEPHCRYDVEKAKELFAESGADMSKTYEIVTNESQTRIDEATIIQQQLAEAGMNVKITVMEYAAYMDYTTGEDKEMFFNGWGAVGFPDPDNNLYGPLHSSGIPENNNTYTNDPKLDEMLDQERSLEDGEEREQLCYDIQKYIRDLTPYVTLENSINLVGLHTYVQGFEAMPPTDQYYNFVSLIGTSGE